MVGDTNSHKIVLRACVVSIAILLVECLPSVLLERFQETALSGAALVLLAINLLWMRLKLDRFLAKVPPTWQLVLGYISIICGTIALQASAWLLAAGLRTELGPNKDTHYAIHDALSVGIGTFVIGLPCLAVSVILALLSGEGRTRSTLCVNFLTGFLTIAAFSFGKLTH